jgi:two-component system response regulator YesN
VKRFFKPRSFNIALFWQFFSSYFILFIVPVIIASTLTYVYVVKLIEDEVENSNNMIMRNFSDQTDAIFSSLQLNMINLLNNSDLKRTIKQFDEPEKSFQYYEVTHYLMGQLNAFDASKVVSNAYLYFANYDLVIGFNMETDKETFYQSLYVVDELDKKEYLNNFTGKKMMHFTKPYMLHDKARFKETILSSSSHISTVMSYPFNSDKPDVYLIVNMKLEELSKQIRIQEKWVAGTAIVDKAGNVISQVGETKIDTTKLLEATKNHSEGALYLEGESGALSFIQSRFNHSWYYASLVDLETLLKPAHRIRTFSLLFLAFFLVMGGFVSYYLSKRLYKPIFEIKSGLTLHRKSFDPAHQQGNDYDFIKQFSKLLISENNELTHMVSSMTPIVQENFITKMLLGEYGDNLSIELYAKEIDFNYDSKAARTVICIEIQYYPWVLEQISETSKSFMRMELKELILKSVSGTVWLCQTRPDLLACVVHHDAFLHIGPKEASACMEMILQQFNTYYKATIGVGKKVQDIGDLYLSYNTAIAMLQHKSLHSRVEVFNEDNTWDDKTPFDGFLSADEVNRIFNLYKAGNYASMLSSVNELLDVGIRNNASSYLVKSLCSDVLNTWIRAVETERNHFNIPFYSSLFDKLNSCVTWDELKQCFQHIHSLLFQVEQSVDQRVQMAEILDHIHKHYSEELSVELFARQLNMSVSHFSRAFKEEVGEKYVDYVTRHRLMMVKKYLLETDMNMDEIAGKVGYMGRNSIIRIFRKYEGITPGQYRSMQRHN